MAEQNDLFNFRIIDKKVVDKSSLFLIQELLLGSRFDPRSKICTRRIPQQNGSEKRGENFWVDPVLSRKANDFTQERSDVVEDVTIVDLQKLRHNL